MIVSIINIENIHQMKEEVTRIATMLETIEGNVRFTMDRRNTHYNLISDLTEGIKAITFFKVLSIIFVSIIQIMIIARFFKNSKKVGLNPFYDSGL
jgi:ABC-type uncharacterized transport system permease subunit